MMVPCDMGPMDLPLRRGPGTPAELVLRVRVPAGAAWAAVVGGDAPTEASQVP